MSKAVLLSIRPEWVEKIAQGEKTVEIRKTRPKLTLPVRCYIYCTLDKHLAFVQNAAGTNLIACMNAKTAISIGSFIGNGKVVGEFMCDRIDRMARIGFDGFRWPPKYCVCNNGVNVGPVDGVCEDACLSEDELEKYLLGNEGYAWHISDLLIYDQPRELEEFRRPCSNDLYCESCAMYSQNTSICGNGVLRLRRPPQSWCYVEGK